MWIDRVSFLTSTSSTRITGRDLKVGLCLTCLVFSLTACAQQSDLVKVEKDLGGKITKLDQEKKALAQVLKQAKQEIADALELQKSELNQELVAAQGQLNETIMQARAQLNSNLRNLREESLPKAKGDLETQIHQVRRNFENAVKQQGQRISALQEQREQREADLSKKIDAWGPRLEQALSQQGQKVKDQFAAFQKSLGQFKNALTDVKKQFDQEAKRAKNSETKVRQDFDRHLQGFRDKLDADTKALKTYLETDVKRAIESINSALNEGNRNLRTDIDAQATRLSEFNVKLGTELTGLRQTDALHGKNLEEVTRSLTQLRDVLGTTGTQLGTKLDSQGKGLEQTAKRIEQLQGQYAALAKKMDADLKGLHGYLDKDVRPSLESIAKAFDQEKNRVSQEFIKVSSGLHHVEQTSVSNVTQAQKQLDVQAKHVQELSQAVAGMREVLDSMAGMLGNRTDQHMNQLGQLTARLAQMEKDQAAEAAMQATNTQTVSTHLNEVTASVQSVGQSFEQFKNLMSTKLKEQANRIESQARQLSKAAGSSAAVSNFQQGLKANVTQLNELTKSVAQLKEVVRAMGEKLGSKVDAHESQLIEVEQALKKFRSPAVPTPSKPKKS
jgi:DNA repair exonuclease SbcCD ATPase subunit